MDDRIFTKDELADYLRITVRMVDKLRSEGMPCLMIGRLVRFRKQDVMEWLEERQKKSENN